jgi:hypothetical protein
LQFFIFLSSYSLFFDTRIGLRVFSYFHSSNESSRPNKPDESIKAGRISSTATGMKDETSSGAAPAPAATVGADTAVAASPVASQPATTPQPVVQSQPQDIQQQQVQQPQPQTPVSPLSQQVVLFYIPIFSGREACIAEFGAVGTCTQELTFEVFSTSEYFGV